MTTVQLAKLCPRCGRIAKGWPLERGDSCSPTDWARCIREPQADWQDVRKETQ